eukprot:CAMPEP_0197855364 /NCGR_PEP_ID=MMETSP1438-20131217/26502_1 /TAXON_ID=1461541 /ORGANISM="Pterosperma sp., Strain CCMP1384" /LENGTH=51 /DNA_ID=CAMNT_0043470447 /DNA_START=74 /DNA_END=225 /DNA_ORIENTATION=-
MISAINLSDRFVPAPIAAAPAGDGSVAPSFLYFGCCTWMAGGEEEDFKGMA